MSLSVSELIKELHGAGIENDDHLLVHSSLSSLGRVDVGAYAVVDALMFG